MSRLRDLRVHNRKAEAELRRLQKQVEGPDRVINDHGALAGLGDNDHPQYITKSTLTTKGDILAATAASTPARRSSWTAKSS